MGKGRLEAFSDGVIAIIITIMVLELKVPHEPTWHALAERWPVFLSYVLSFIFVGIYWGNHHHLVHTVKHVSGSVMWANMALLFCLSLIPFSTEWLGETGAASAPTALYGLNMLFCGFAYQALQVSISRQQTEDAGKTAHQKSAAKGMISLVSYVSAVVFAFIYTPVSLVLFVGVALMWLMPDKRFEAAVEGH